MAGYVSRSAGDASFTKPGQRYGNGNGKANVLTRSPPSTPLQNFVRAKEKINGVYGNVEEYVKEVTDFMTALAHDRSEVSDHHATACAKFRESVRTIRDVLNRDHMKVVFFGRTSNGKSTCINAMLHSKVLPSGIGHTTRCFLQVEGSKTGDKYVISEDKPDDKKSIESIDQLGHALCSKELGEDALVRICWPKTDSKLLQNEVAIVDSPGIDVSPQFDAWIDKHCLDADVFVLVSNAESTLTHTEKNFFFRVNERISRPNLFILNNRWDASAAEPEMMDQVRQQHTERFVKFLVEELEVCSFEEARRRIFFVSAREMLSNRLKDKGVSSPNMHMVEGYQSRMLEFEEFEREFELCISSTAINTKFDAHVEKGRRILTSLHDMLGEVHTLLSTESDNKSQLHSEQLAILKATQRDLNQFLREMREKIIQLSAEVQLKVSTDLTEEIRRLDLVIDNFRRSFSDSPSVLNDYKQEMICFIDTTLVHNLQSRCTGSMLTRILTVENEMFMKMCAMLPDNYGDGLRRLSQFRTPFEFTFAFNCKTMLDDFQEDLEFRFSLGFSSLIRRFTQLRSGSTANGLNSSAILGGGGLIPRSLSTPDMDQSIGQDLSATEDAVMKSLVYTTASYVANGGVGLLIVGGVVYRSVGLRVIALVGAIYGMLYVYERLSWNDRAKERQFKQQLRRHIATRLKQLSGTVTMNCESQVTREVQDCLTRLQGIASDAQNEMKHDVDMLQKEASELEKIAKQLNSTKGKATFLGSELVNFNETYLQSK